MSTPPASRTTATPPHTLADVLAAIAVAELPERRKQDLRIGGPLRGARARPAAGAGAGRSAVAGEPAQRDRSTGTGILESALEQRAFAATGGARAGGACRPGPAPDAADHNLGGAVGSAADPEAEDPAVAPAALLQRRRHRAARHRRGNVRRLSRAPGADAAARAAGGVPRNTARLERGARAGFRLARSHRQNIPTRRTAWTLPWSAFPESLHQDVIRYLDRLGGRDPLEELPYRPVRPLTLRHREYQLRCR
jgi:hypothetical protein